MKNREKVLTYTLNKPLPLFFTGRKMRPPGIKIEGPGNEYDKEQRRFVAVTKGGNMSSPRLWAHQFICPLSPGLARPID